MSFNLDDAFAQQINDNLTEGQNLVKINFDKSQPRHPARKFKTDMLIKHRDEVMSELGLDHDHPYSNSELLDLMKRPENLLLTGKCPMGQTDFSRFLININLEERHAKLLNALIVHYPHLNPKLSTKNFLGKVGDFNRLVTANVTYGFFASFVGNSLGFKSKKDVLKYFDKATYLNNQKLKPHGSAVLFAPTKPHTVGKLYIEHVAQIIETSLVHFKGDEVIFVNPPSNFNINIGFKTRIETIETDVDELKVVIFTKE